MSDLLTVRGVEKSFGEHRVLHDVSFEVPAHGIAAMQSINVAVINRWFLAAFVGTAIACIAASSRPAPSSTTPSGLPAPGRSANTSSCR